MAEAALIQKPARTRRDIAIGIFVALVALLILLLWFLMLRADELSLSSTFVMTSLRSGVEIPAPDLVLPGAATLLVLASIMVGLSVWQFIRPFTKTTWLIAVASGTLVMAFLVWATRGDDINLTGMLVSSLVRATPIALAALSGLYSERSGVVNIAIEGMMLVGAFTSVVVTSIAKNALPGWLEGVALARDSGLTMRPDLLAETVDAMVVEYTWLPIILGIIGGILAGMLLAWIHGVLSIKFRVDQIVSGAGLIILALGLTSYLQRAVLNPNPELNQPGPAIASAAIPGLWKIPVIGPLLFNLSPIIYVMFALLIITRILMNNTRWGLRVRAVGEHPKAADTLGINVFKTRYMSVLISGAIAGLAGTYMSLGSAGRFNEGMTAGKGFLGLAAMIFGNWNPGGAFLGSLIFGFFDSWQEKLALLQVGVAGELLGMAPYLATMIVLAGFIGRSRMPAADGQPYEKQ
jgi:simple sugar transport system permease protein